VRNKTKDVEVLTFKELEEFSSLLLIGDIKWIFSEQKNVVFSYGPHPGLILPEIKADYFAFDDLLEISIKLKETGIQQFIDGKDVCVADKISPDEAKKNTIQLYWDTEGVFIKKKSQQKYYLIEEWTEFSFELLAEEVPLWLRLDLSCRPGMIEIDYIAVRNTTQQKEIMAFRKQEDFQVLFLTSNLTWIFPERKNIMCSSGAESTLILPAVEKDRAVPGDLLKIIVRLRESEMRQFFEREQANVNAIDIEPVAPPRWKKFLQIFQQRLGWAR
jgi:hypothetical protein